MSKNFRTAAWALVLTASLSACGGGGSSPAPTPAAPATLPPPPPPPPPVEEGFNTAEFRRSTGLSLINAIPAYESGVTGEGVIVGIIDSGADLDHPDLAENIVASRNLAAFSLGADDEDGHGTAVAGVVASVRNGIGRHGVAFDSKLVISRTDDPGSCSDDGCSHFSSDIARGIDYAVENGARIINISLGGGDGGVSNSVRSSIQRAVRAGAGVVMSAGNDSEADPDGFTRVASDPSALGGVIIAGATDSLGQIADFSNRAGEEAENYVVAPGIRIRSLDINGGSALWSGTSFAAPQVAGLAALILSASPELSPQDVLEIIKVSAEDRGIAGVDAIYGHGLIDVGAALAPIGEQMIETADSSSENDTEGDGEDDEGAADGTQSGMQWGAAFGRNPVRDSHFSEIAFRDRFGRAYLGDFSRQSVTTTSSPDLDSIALNDQRMSRASLSITENMRFGFTAFRSNPTLPGNNAQDAERFGHQSPLSPWFQSFAHDVSTQMSFTGVTDGGLSFAMVSGGSLGQLPAARPIGAPLNGFLARGTEGAALDLAMGDGANIAVSQSIGRFDISFRGGHGTRQADVLTGLTVNSAIRFDQADRSQSEIGFARRFGGLRLGLDLGVIVERDQVLGSRTSGAFQLGEGAHTRYLALGAEFDFGDGWLMSGRLMRGQTEVDAARNSLITNVGTIRSSSFAVSLAKSDLFSSGDALAFAISQPLRVDRGDARLTIPTAFRENKSVFSSDRLGLAPTGRALDLEASYQMWAHRGLRLHANMLMQLNPDHNHDAPAAASLLLRLSKSIR
ncbi:MAG: S8 family serine peptidase [Pseudomonadota bacterium]